jgi:hypothetical protein
VSVRKVVAVLVLGYVTLALYYRAREAAGLLTAIAIPTAGVASQDSASSGGSSLVPPQPRDRRLEGAAS